MTEQRDRLLRILAALRDAEQGSNDSGGNCGVCGFDAGHGHAGSTAWPPASGYPPCPIPGAIADAEALLACGQEEER
jgi:hypothetical protein